MEVLGNNFTPWKRVALGPYNNSRSARKYDARILECPFAPASLLSRAGMPLGRRQWVFPAPPTDPSTTASVTPRASSQSSSLPPDPGRTSAGSAVCTLFAFCARVRTEGGWWFRQLSITQLREVGTGNNEQYDWPDRLPG